MLKFDEFTIYTKTKITCDDGQIFVGPEEHKVRSIGHYAILEEVTMHLETEMGARIMSIIATGGHEAIRNLSEPSDQTLMHINVYADYSRTISPHTPTGAIEALLTKVAEN